MLNTIRNALLGVDPNVYFGGVTNTDKINKWDYIVFSRGDMKRNVRGNTAYSTTINVVVVREEYVPEETIYRVIEVMEGIPNVRLNENAVEFEYDRKGNTKTVMEMAVISFSWMRKKADIA